MSKKISNEEVLSDERRAVIKFIALLEAEAGKQYDVAMMSATRTHIKPFKYNDGTEVTRFFYEAKDLVGGHFYQGHADVKDSPVGVYKLTLQAILGKSFWNYYGDIGPNCEAIIGKKFFGILKTERWNEWDEGKRRERASTYVYRILPYVPYLELLENRELSKNNGYPVVNKEWLKADIKLKENHALSALRTYRGHPHSKI